MLLVRVLPLGATDGGSVWVPVGGAVAVIMLDETLCCPFLLGPLGGR